MNPLLKTTLLCVTALAAFGLRAAEDLVLADFEVTNYGAWKVTGEAFGPGPAKGTLPGGQMPVDGFLGKGLVNSGLPASAPPARLALQLDRGISLDRQFRQIPPEPIMRFTRKDIRLIKSSGFEFVKLIVNPEPLRDGAHLDTQKREYLREIVSQVVNEGLPVVVCLHPEWEFKKRILGERPAFAEFLVFLQEVSSRPSILAGPTGRTTRRSR